MLFTLQKITKKEPTLVYNLPNGSKKTIYTLVFLEAKNRIKTAIENTALKDPVRISFPVTWLLRDPVNARLTCSGLFEEAGYNIRLARVPFSR